MIQEEALRCSVFRMVEFLQLGGIHGAISVLLTGSDFDDLNTACCFHNLAVHIHPPLVNINSAHTCIHLTESWPHHLQGKMECM